MIVGVNKYRRANEDLLETLEVDNSKVREAQIARINRVKADRDEAACEAALDALTLRALARDPRGRPPDAAAFAAELRAALSDPGRTPRWPALPGLGRRCDAHPD